MHDKPAIRCQPQEIEAAWYRAMDAGADLVVVHEGGKEEVYHPPYPYSDSVVAGLKQCPGATWGVTMTTPGWMREAQRYWDDRHPWAAFPPEEP